jgi:hypothetical protein
MTVKECANTLDMAHFILYTIGQTTITVCDGICRCNDSIHRLRSISMNNIRLLMDIWKLLSLRKDAYADFMDDTGKLLKELYQ